jgi:hypothetical protein
MNDVIEQVMFEGLADLPSQCYVGSVPPTSLSHLMKLSPNWFVMAHGLRSFTFAVLCDRGYQGDVNEITYNPDITNAYKSHLDSWGGDRDEDDACSFCTLPRLVPGCLHEDECVCEFVCHTAEFHAYREFIDRVVAVNMSMEKGEFQPADVDRNEEFMPAPVSRESVDTYKALISTVSYTSIVEALGSYSFIGIQGCSRTVIANVLRAKSLVCPKGDLLVVVDRLPDDWGSKNVDGRKAVDVAVSYHVVFREGDPLSADWVFSLYKRLDGRSGASLCLSVDVHSILLSWSSSGDHSFPIVVTSTEFSSCSFVVDDYQFFSDLDDPQVDFDLFTFLQTFAKDRNLNMDLCKQLVPLLCYKSHMPTYLPPDLDYDLLCVAPDLFLNPVAPPGSPICHPLVRRFAQPGHFALLYSDGDVDCVHHFLRPEVTYQSTAPCLRVRYCYLVYFIDGVSQPLYVSPYSLRSFSLGTVRPFYRTQWLPPEGRLFGDSPGPVLYMIPTCCDVSTEHSVYSPSVSLVFDVQCGLVNGEIYVLDGPSSLRGRLVLNCPVLLHGDVVSVEYASPREIYYVGPPCGFLIHQKQFTNLITLQGYSRIIPYRSKLMAYLNHCRVAVASYGKITAEVFAKLADLDLRMSVEVLKDLHIRRLVSFRRPGSDDFHLESLADEYMAR